MDRFTLTVRVLAQLALWTDTTIAEKSATTLCYGDYLSDRDRTKCRGEALVALEATLPLKTDSTFAEKKGNEGD